MANSTSVDRIKRCICPGFGGEGWFTCWWRIIGGEFGVKVELSWVRIWVLLSLGTLKSLLLPETKRAWLSGSEYLWSPDSILLCRYRNGCGIALSFIPCEQLLNILGVGGGKGLINCPCRCFNIMKIYSKKICMILSLDTSKRLIDIISRFCLIVNAHW